MVVDRGRRLQPDGLDDPVRVQTDLLGREAVPGDGQSRGLKLYDPSHRQLIPSSVETTTWAWNQVNGECRGEHDNLFTLSSYVVGNPLLVSSRPFLSDDREFNDGHDSCERHSSHFVDAPDVLCIRRAEPAKARFVARDVERAEIRNVSVVSRESYERFLEPRTVAAWKVSLHEIGRHLRSTIAERSGSNNRANLWIYSSGVAAMRAASSVRELTPSFR